VVLAGIYGMTAKQIAELESIPLGTAKTRIRTAMEKLRIRLSVKRADHE
jgi:RNA polymerase sigma-70 factor (ECF subfamily)